MVSQVVVFIPKWQNQHSHILMNYFSISRTVMLISIFFSNTFMWFSSRILVYFSNGVIMRSVLLIIAGSIYAFITGDKQAQFCILLYFTFKRFSWNSWICEIMSS